jgi:hypothetical protein
VKYDKLKKRKIMKCKMCLCMLVFDMRDMRIQSCQNYLESEHKYLRARHV